ncbi:hypothetical protein LEN26_009205 [Aphanomyces euteiches]|nr:hypothetical protein AeMF1_007368 [Aphanomyces euteiches]KAH9120506.1 hypothetical protein AeMF1_007391 [Aphanomyces euteiches]KAH9127803.1 hypothetical protein LEN26_009205 [Aphanomyces euteiches]KAH9193008.1 hypothetical protein AeNC1_005008 [Aphanomyces euteiches]
MLFSYDPGREDLAGNWSMKRILTAVVTFAAVFQGILAESAAGNVAVLRPNELVTKQVIFPNRPVVYELQTDLDQAYEVKLSYRATTPSIFKLRILDSNELNERIQYRNMRRVLNTEKTFVRGVPGKVFFVEVAMQVEGISYRLSKEQMDERRTEFDILLEEVVLQALPRSSITLILVAVAMLTSMFLCVYPHVLQLVSPVHNPTKIK